MNKTNGVKLLAAVMVMAMVFAGASVILSDSDVNAAPATDGLIDLGQTESGDNWSFSSGTLELNGVNLDQGFYYGGDLKIIVAGDNTITDSTTAAANTSTAFASIYATGSITIQGDDNTTTTNKLTITVNGTTTGIGGSEWTYGIYAGNGLSISNIAVDITVATADKYAFAIEGNGSATTFTNVTGTIDGGNRAIQMGANSTLTFTGCNLTLTGSEKAIQSKMTGGKIVIEENSIINAKINSSYAGSNTGEDDGFAIKAVNISVDNTSTLNTDGLRVVYPAEANDEYDGKAALDGNVVINDYVYGNAEKPEIGFTVDKQTTVTVGDGSNDAKLTINSVATLNGDLTINGKATAEINNIVDNNANLINNGTYNNYRTTTVESEKTFTNNGTYNNYGTLDVYGTVTGKVNNARGFVSVQDLANVDGFTVDGGNLVVPEGKMPLVTDGTVVKIGEYNYSAYTFTLSNGAKVTIGVNAVQYDSAKNYAGTGGSVVVRILDSTTTSINFFGMNEVYEKPEDAAAGNKEYGTVTDVGSYPIVMNLQADVNGSFVTTPVTAMFNILPVDISKVADVESIPDQAYTGDQVTPEVTVTYNSKELVLGTDYEVVYGENITTGEVTVKFIGNYTGSKEATFDIIENYTSIEVDTNPTDTEYFIGESLNTDGIVINGVKDSGASEAISTGLTYSPQVFDTEGTVAVTVSYENIDGTTLTTTFDVTVYGVASIVITTEPTTKTYNAGQAIDTNGLKVTVTYKDDVSTTREFTDDGNGLAYDGTVDDNFKITPDVFDEATGKKIPVTVSYFGASAGFNVTVDGAIITYMDNEGPYGTQAGEVGQNVAVYAYAKDAPEGQEFTGWLVQGFSIVYQPGDMIELDGDDNMWNNGAITLVAQFENSTEITPGTPSEDVIVGVYYDESTHGRVIVTLTAMDGGYITAGTVTISGNYTTMVEVPGLGLMPQTSSYTATLDVAEGQTSVVFSVDDDANDFSFISGIISMDATYTSGDMSDASNHMTYTFVAPTTEA